MTAYYNEFDPKATAWLRELIKQGHIADGVVDERSITDVKPEDLAGFTQCHFFAGIGGWSYALRLAGIPDDFPCWTGSPPCQPFSTAGKQLGQLDERHLGPTFMRLVDECKPAILFGEQVAAAIGKHWLDDLFTELERQGYACGSAVLPACSIGAPHKRDRLFFGSKLVVHANNEYQHAASNEEGVTDFNRSSVPLNKLADSNRQRPQGEWSNSNSQRRKGSDIRPTRLCGRARNEIGPMANTDHNRKSSSKGRREGDRNKEGHDIRRSGSHGIWANPDWLACPDGKFRPVIASFITMVDGFPDSMGCGGYPRIRGKSEVFKLPEGVSAEAFFFGRAGKPIHAETSEVLRSEVHGKRARRSASLDSEELSPSIGESFDPSLYEMPEDGRQDACAPQGREPFKQRPVEFDDLMRELSQQSTLAELQQRDYDAQALCALRDACSEKWAVQHSFVEVESAWSSFSEEDKVRERMDFNAGIWRRVEFFPLSSGEEGRTGRLRGLTFSRQLNLLYLHIQWFPLGNKNWPERVIVR